MATRLKDDLDGQELPAGTEPVRLSLGDTTYRLHLSEQNQEKLLRPWSRSPPTRRSRTPSGG